MDLPGDLRFTRDHMWLRSQPDGVCIGVTDFAQRELGDIVFADVPRVGTAVVKGAPLGWLESTKAVVDLNSPLDGTIVATNAALADKPERINRDPYGEGWLCTIVPTSAEDASEWLDPDGYRDLVREIARESPS